MKSLEVLDISAAVATSLPSLLVQAVEFEQFFFPIVWFQIISIPHHEGNWKF